MASILDLLVRQVETNPELWEAWPPNDLLRVAAPPGCGHYPALRLYFWADDQRVVLCRVELYDELSGELKDPSAYNPTP